LQLRGQHKFDSHFHTKMLIMLQKRENLGNLLIKFQNYLIEILMVITIFRFLIAKELTYECMVAVS